MRAMAGTTSRSRSPPPIWLETMLNREVLYKDPASFRIANDGVAKVSFPPPSDVLEVLRGELDAFVCDGAYAAGLAKMLETFNATAGRTGAAPAVWISGFYGSGKSHLYHVYFEKRSFSSSGSRMSLT